MALNVDIFWDLTLRMVFDPVQCDLYINTGEGGESGVKGLPPGFTSFTGKLDIYKTL